MSSLYSFTSLQKTVEQAFGIEIDPDGGDFKVEQKITRLESHEIDKVIFKDGEIYLKDGDVLIQGFLVLDRKYYKAFYDKVIQVNSYLPKFHTTRCKTLEKMESNGHFNGVYIFSNTTISKADSPQGDDSGPVRDYRICGNCKNDDIRIDDYINSSQFVDEHLDTGEVSTGFKKQELPKEYEKDEWGYVNGWDEISLAYRAKKDYTCEKCGINLSKNKYYLEVHHLNSNKTDNLESNLQCLCTECHSNVDQFHRDNFYNQDANRKKLMDFKRLFRD